MTKKEKRFFEAYSSFTAKDLTELYKKPSRAKLHAADCITRLCNLDGGFGLYFGNPRSQFFSAAYVHADPVTGEARLKYLTGQKEYDFIIDYKGEN